MQSVRLTACEAVKSCTMFSITTDFRAKNCSLCAIYIIFRFQNHMVQGLTTHVFSTHDHLNASTNHLPTKILQIVLLY